MWCACILLSVSLLLFHPLICVCACLRRTNREAARALDFKAVVVVAVKSLTVMAYKMTFSYGVTSYQRPYTRKLVFELQNELKQPHIDGAIFCTNIVIVMHTHTHETKKQKRARERAYTNTYKHQTEYTHSQLNTHIYIYN